MPNVEPAQRHLPSTTKLGGVVSALEDDDERLAFAREVSSDDRQRVERRRVAERQPDGVSFCRAALVFLRPELHEVDKPIARDVDRGVELGRELRRPRNMTVLLARQREAFVPALSVTDAHRLQVEPVEPRRVNDAHLELRRRRGDLLEGVLEVVLREQVVGRIGIALFDRAPVDRRERAKRRIDRDDTEEVRHGRDYSRSIRARQPHTLATWARPTPPGVRSRRARARRRGERQHADVRGASRRFAAWGGGLPLSSSRGA